MRDDDIIQEIRATRDAFAARHNYDVRSMVAELQAQQAASGIPAVTFPPRRPVPVAVAHLPALAVIPPVVAVDG
jgi:hypothetical protein